MASTKTRAAASTRTACQRYVLLMTLSTACTRFVEGQAAEITVREGGAHEGLCAGLTGSANGAKSERREECGALNLTARRINGGKSERRKRRAVSLLGLFTPFVVSLLILCARFS